MADVAIEVEQLSKRYRIGALKPRHDTLGAQLARLASWRPGRTKSGDDESNVLWSLRDLSFDVERGSALGIVGHNGAGKSTLLKILSRVTRPTTGRAILHGRVGSLLEVGTGFHHELTGRDNVYLSGAVLGMSRQEIDAKFDAIVDFAEVERFIETPVKRYSSGMYLRLAFAVAVHLEPEILIVDEVLAVGDAQFQRKCLDKMQDVRAAGRTILFVSHNLPAVTRLCERAILLERGRLIADGPSADVIASYVSPNRGTANEREWVESDAPGGNVARLRAACVRSAAKDPGEHFDIRCAITIDVEYDVFEGGSVLMPFVHLHDESGVFLFSAHDLDPEWTGRPRPAGRWVSTVEIPGNMLAEGTHAVSVGVMTQDPVVMQFHERDVLSFRVVEPSPEGTARGGWQGPMGGVVRPALAWRNTRTHDVP